MPTRNGAPLLPMALTALVVLALAAPFTYKVKIPLAHTPATCVHCRAAMADSNVTLTPALV